jgi:aerobic-type carbon monoxide dehydrogenase small subunit (CoxS/CutS family)
MALCGACTVHVDGMPTRSCVTPVSAVGGKKITTIEAIGETPSGKKVQEAWLDLEVVQCGYCQSGQIMSASALLVSHPDPTDGCWRDNVFVERLWKSVKYEEVYLRAYASVSEAKAGLDTSLSTTCIGHTRALTD